MIMKVEEPDIKTTEPTAEQLAAAKSELDKKLKTRKKSWGERAYDWLVYQGIGFGANEVGSMAVTGMFERGKNKLLGRPRFEQWEAGLMSKFKWKQSTANAFLMTASLNLVGCFVVPAIKFVDNYKSTIVKKLNHWHNKDGLTEEQITARDKEVETAIACEPTQTWKTLILGRMVSMCITISNGTYLCGKKLKSGALNFNEKLQRGFDEVSSAVGRNVGLKKYTDGGKNYYSGPFPKATEVNAFHYYAGLAGPETMGCLISSTVLEGVSKFSAKMNPLVRNKDICTEAVREIAKKKTIQPRADSHAQQISSGEAVGPRTL